MKTINKEFIILPILAVIVVWFLLCIHTIMPDKSFEGVYIGKEEFEEVYQNKFLIKDTTFLIVYVASKKEVRGFVVDLKTYNEVELLRAGQKDSIIYHKLKILANMP